MSLQRSKLVGCVAREWISDGLTTDSPRKDLYIANIDVERAIIRLKIGTIESTMEDNPSLSYYDAKHTPGKHPELTVLYIPDYSDSEHRRDEAIKEQSRFFRLPPGRRRYQTMTSLPPYIRVQQGDRPFEQTTVSVTQKRHLSDPQLNFCYRHSSHCYFSLKTLLNRS